MLYKDSFIEQPKQDFLFEAKPYNEDINLKEIAAIEVFYEENGYIPDRYIPSFLNWLTYMTRTNISNSLESVMDASMAGKCAIAQSYLDAMLEKFNLSHITFNVGDVLGTEMIHALTKVTVPTVIDDNLTAREFVLDPTFRQFCLTEENRFERYNEEPRWAVKMSAPHPGYFFNLTEDGRNFANNLICYGYFEATDDNLKQYFDPFALYVTPKEAYENEEFVGKISSTDTTGNEYRKKVEASAKDPLNVTRGFSYETPRENIEYEQNRLINRIKRKFGKSELDEMFTITDETSQHNKTK